MGLAIGELAQRAGVTRRTIRYYVEIGLLQPPAGAGKAAAYGAEHLERLELIRELQAHRLSLEEIRDRLAGKPVPSAEELVALGPQDLAQTHRLAQADFTSAAQYIADLRRTEAMPRPPSTTEGGPAYMQAGIRSESKPLADFDAEQWLRVRLSQDVELHVRRRASRTHRWLNRLIKEARRILAEEEVE
jgi:DNA-binding transcriptional MerR regulator